MRQRWTFLNTVLLVILIASLGLALWETIQGRFPYVLLSIVLVVVATLILDIVLGKARR